MSHLLMIEAPGGNDFDLFEEALRSGHRISFFTANRQHYECLPGPQQLLRSACRVEELHPFTSQSLLARAQAIHAADPFDALLCHVDIRIIEAAELASALQLRFLNVNTARLLRDKFSVREVLQSKGIRQPEFALATSNDQLRRAADRLGLPFVVKPCDGYGSQNVALFLDADDVNPLIDPFAQFLPCRTDYGLGVIANDRMLVERYVPGTLLGCDTYTVDGKHCLLGINEKQMFPPPSGAISGSVFPSTQFPLAQVRDYVLSVLDAVGFDQGIAHTELIWGDQGPMLVECNPRLVGAKLPRLLNMALGRNVHRDVIELYLGAPLSAFSDLSTQACAALRWIVADRVGVLDAISVPEVEAGAVVTWELLKQPGERVSWPMHNADRLGYVMALADTRSKAEALVEQFIAATKVDLRAA